jgi:hypothetical protein
VHRRAVRSGTAVAGQRHVLQRLPGLKRDRAGVDAERLATRVERVVDVGRGGDQVPAGRRGVAVPVGRRGGVLLGRPVGVGDSAGAAGRAVVRVEVDRLGVAAEAAAGLTAATPASPSASARWPAARPAGGAFSISGLTSRLRWKPPATPPEEVSPRAGSPSIRLVPVRPSDTLKDRQTWGTVRCRADSVLDILRKALIDREIWPHILLKAG